jgi:hypothetical protein
MPPLLSKLSVSAVTVDIMCLEGSVHQHKVSCTGTLRMTLCLYYSLSHIYFSFSLQVMGNLSLYFCLVMHSLLDLITDYAFTFMVTRHPLYASSSNLSYSCKFRFLLVHSCAGPSSFRLPDRCFFTYS